MLRRLPVLAGLLLGCAASRSSAPLEPAIEQAGEIAALCGTDDSCRRRMQMTAHGAQAEDASTPPPDPQPEVAPGTWYCFMGGGPGRDLGACEHTFPECSVTEQAAREVGVIVTTPCQARTEVSCFGVLRDETAVLYCAPTPAVCQRMEKQVSTDTGVEPFAPCELVGNDLPEP